MRLRRYPISHCSILGVQTKWFSFRVNQLAIIDLVYVYLSLITSDLMYWSLAALHTGLLTLLLDPECILSAWWEGWNCTRAVNREWSEIVCFLTGRSELLWFSKRTLINHTLELGRPLADRSHFRRLLRIIAFLRFMLFTCFVTYERFS